MTVKKPHPRNYRPFVNGVLPYCYIHDAEYAKDSEHNVRAYMLIQEDLKKILEYFEYSDSNKESYSSKIHELYMRTCIEVEANFKAILTENIYTNPKKDDFTMKDYKLLNKTHRLSSYRVIAPIWDETNPVFEPFKQWKDGYNLNWYHPYYLYKQDNQKEFKETKIKPLINAVCGLLILISSQFKNESLAPKITGRNWNGRFGFYDAMEYEEAIGDFFRISFPTDWPEEEKYDFSWEELKNDPNRFEKINYDGLQEND